MPLRLRVLLLEHVEHQSALEKKTYPIHRIENRTNLLSSWQRVNGCGWTTTAQKDKESHVSMKKTRWPSTGSIVRQDSDWLKCKTGSRFRTTIFSLPLFFFFFHSLLLILHTRPPPLSTADEQGISPVMSLPYTMVFTLLMTEVRDRCMKSSGHITSLGRTNCILSSSSLPISLG